MPFSVNVFFRNLFRPEVTSAQCAIYENGKPFDYSKYSDLHLQSLIKAIDDLFPVEAKSPYWFETDIYEQGSLFKKPKMKVCVTCYCKDMFTNGYKKKFAIPIKYRKRMFDTIHTIRPEPVGTKTWPVRMEVKFYLPG